MRTAALEPGHRIQLPAEWVEEMGLESGAELEKVAEGILIHASKRLTWDEVFASKLVAGASTKNSTPDTESDAFEVCNDDLLY